MTAAAVITDPAFALSIRWVLAALFATAVVHKLSAPSGFVGTVRTYRLLPRALAPLVAYALIAAEAATVIALLANLRLGSLLAAALLVVYTGAIGLNLWRGRRDIDCGCSGPYVRQTLSLWLVVRNAAFLAAAAATLLPATSSRALGGLDWFTAVAAAGAFVLVYFAANQIAFVSNRAGPR